MGKREVEQAIKKGLEQAVMTVLRKVQEHQHVQNAKVQAGFDEFEQRIKVLEVHTHDVDVNDTTGPPVHSQLVRRD